MLYVILKYLFYYLAFGVVVSTLAMIATRNKKDEISEKTGRFTMWVTFVFLWLPFFIWGQYKTMKETFK